MKWSIENTRTGHVLFVLDCPKHAGLVAARRADMEGDPYRVVGVRADGSEADGAVTYYRDPRKGWTSRPAYSPSPSWEAAERAASERRIDR